MVDIDLDDEFEEEVEQHWDRSWDDYPDGPNFVEAWDFWYGDGWPSPEIVATWSRYERRWVEWERSIDEWWSVVGHYEEAPAAWERGFRKWVAQFRPTTCVYCSSGAPAYAEGSCRTCYRWLARNRDRYEEHELLGELAKRVETRRLSRIPDRSCDTRLGRSGGSEH